jgi:hypothetical protein
VTFAGRGLERTLAMGFGAAFLLIGVAGFVPGLTRGLDGLAAAGTATNAKLLGVFEVSVLHNAIHLAFAAGLIAAMSAAASRAYLATGAAFYTALALAGVFVDDGDRLNVIPSNGPSDVSHVLFAAAFAAAYVVARRERTADPVADEALRAPDSGAHTTGRTG